MQFTVELLVMGVLTWLAFFAASAFMDLLSWGAVEWGMATAIGTVVAAVMTVGAALRYGHRDDL
jgi:hypothetical protein